MNDNKFLSKSLFIRGCQCHKSLWLQKNGPELKCEIPGNQQALFNGSTDIGIMAHQLFPSGIEIPYECLTFNQQLEQTKSEVSKGTGTIYEAAFLYDGIFVKADILHNGPYGWEIYEVKGSTGVKDVYLYDAAVQYHVLKGSGLDISKVSIVYINNQYIRYGDLDIGQFFTVKDSTEDILELQPFIVQEVSTQRKTLSGDTPAIDIGPQCEEPYRCDFMEFCWQHIPKDSVFDLSGRGINKFDLYRQGIIKQSDIPLDMLNSAQRLQVKSTINQQNYLNKEKIHNFISDLWYPLCFLDFETVNPAIPMFDGCRPYGRMPFQYSLHLQSSANAELQHFEYLAKPGIDPRQEILESLIENIPEDACIIAWNQSFEIGVLRDLAELFPKHKEQLDGRIGNFRDLMQPFRSRDIYLWEAKGSYSIKPNLPLLVPELSYKNLDGIANGGDAMDGYYKMNSTDDPVELEIIRRQLLEYCKLDTEAMVRMLEEMRKLLSK